MNELLDKRRLPVFRYFLVLLSPLNAAKVAEEEASVREFQLTVQPDGKKKKYCCDTLVMNGHALDNAASCGPRCRSVPQ